jgi:16S rRNA (cytidine1402-2'-O)-methyltransferase
MDPSTLPQAPGGRGTASGTLFVVATPIGNLEDITLRALRILREVTLVAAEDTRRTGNLLRHYHIDTPLISLHEHNEDQRIGPLVGRLQAGESVAVVSDAGTPGISDPGSRLVRAARLAGIRVDPVPGPSAVTAILSASGLSFDRFAFAGFPPIRLNDRKNWFSWVSSLGDVPVVCFESPHRIRRLLDDARALLAERPILLARELTKVHEQWLGPADEILERGEFVIVFGRMAKSALGYNVPDDSRISALFGQITGSTEIPNRRSAIKAVATQLGIPSKTVYQALERAKKQPA